MDQQLTIKQLITIIACMVIVTVIICAAIIYYFWKKRDQIQLHNENLRNGRPRNRLLSAVRARAKFDQTPKAISRESLLKTAPKSPDADQANENKGRKENNILNENDIENGNGKGNNISTNRNGCTNENQILNKNVNGIGIGTGIKPALQHLPSNLKLSLPNSSNDQVNTHKALIPLFGIPPELSLKYGADIRLGTRLAINNQWETVRGELLTASETSDRIFGHKGPGEIAIKIFLGKILCFFFLVLRGKKVELSYI